MQLSQGKVDLVHSYAESIGNTPLSLIISRSLYVCNMS